MGGGAGMGRAGMGGAAMGGAAGMDGAAMGAAAAVAARLAPTAASEGVRGRKARAKKDGWPAPAGGTARKRQRQRSSVRCRVWICCLWDWPGRVLVGHWSQSVSQSVSQKDVTGPCERMTRAHTHPREDGSDAVPAPQEHGLEGRVGELRQVLLHHHPAADEPRGKGVGADVSRGEAGPCAVQ